MFDNGNTGSSNPFGPSSGFDSYVMPPALKRNSKLWLIPVVVIGALAVIAALVFAVWTINLTQTNVQQRNGDSQEKVVPSEEETYLEPVATYPDLDALNAIGPVIWSEDPFNYIGDYPPLAVYLSENGPDLSSCALRFYADYESANAALAGDSLDFTSYESNKGKVPANDMGYLLLSDTQETECALQAFKYLGY